MPKTKIPITIPDGQTKETVLMEAISILGNLRASSKKFESEFGHHNRKRKRYWEQLADSLLHEVGYIAENAQPAE